MNYIIGFQRFPSKTALHGVSVVPFVRVAFVLLGASQLPAEAGVLYLYIGLHEMTVCSLGYHFAQQVLADAFSCHTLYIRHLHTCNAYIFAVRDAF